MRRNIFELINEDLDLKNEYIKLMKLFKNEQIYYTKTSIIRKFSLYECFDNAFNTWKYRRTFTNVKELLDKLELYDILIGDPINKILNLIELIFNAEKHCDRKKIYYKLNSKSKIIHNTEIILDCLGYTQIDDGDKIILALKNADAIETAKEVDDTDIARSIIEYLDYRIEKDLVTKKDILTRLLNYLEPYRKQIKNIDSGLEDMIFFLGNNAHIRHNNKDGKNEKKYISDLEAEKLLEIYDREYGLILSAIRILEFKNEKGYYNNLKEKINQ